MLVDTVELFLDKYNLLNSKNNIIVAFSGGYDSMCLLDVVKILSKKYDFNVVAVHLNHNWRGEESDLEELNCKKFAHDITFYSEKLSSDIPHTETAARDARYEFFERCAKKFNSNVVLTAHNANDNAETVFYRILKGTGITGLEGIREKRGIYYRPLLSVYRSEIEDYCKINNLSPNLDSSNFDNKFLRNKIRNEIFPMCPEIIEKLNILSKSASSANEFVDKQIMPLDNYSTSEFANLDSYLQSSVVHKFFRDNGLDYDRKKIEYILNFITDNRFSKSGKTVSLTDDLWLFVNCSSIDIVHKREHFFDDIDVDLDIQSVYDLGNGQEFVAKMVTDVPMCFPDDADFVAYLSLTSTKYTLRTRKDGDVISPLGMSGSQKLKKYFNGKHIPKYKRDDIILLASGSEVLWAAGVGISEKVKAYKSPIYKVMIRGKNK